MNDGKSYYPIACAIIDAKMRSGGTPRICVYSERMRKRAEKVAEMMGVKAEIIVSQL